MNAELLQAYRALQTARDYLRSGNRSEARRWAEQAARIAPQLEDPWLILAAVASPKTSVKYIQRALQINPDSPRAQKGMQWALKRLQQIPSTQKASPTPRTKVTGSSRPTVAEKPHTVVTGKRSQPRAAKRSAAPAIPLQRVVYPILLLTLGCLLVSAVAWVATTTPVLASIVNGTSQPAQAEHPKVWAKVDIAKPSSASEPSSEGDFVFSPPTSEPQIPVTSDDPTQQPPSPTLEPTVTLAASTSTAETNPTAVPEATSTPAGSLGMEFVEDTPVPTARPTSDAPANHPGGDVHWIEVNLSEQRTYAWEGENLVKTFVVSTGTWATPTVVGTFKIWNKTPIQTMSGPGYSLPNVPNVMYFYEDYGFHGTYWHNNFGTPMSHGCVNLTIPDSEWLYNWASYGTTVIVHY
jgi:lipoprotein-anchoring transpeptidase ErfK/SrfK